MGPAIRVVYVVQLVEVDAEQLLNVGHALLQRIAVDVQLVGGLLDGEVVLEERVERLVEARAMCGVVLEQRSEGALDDV